MARTTVALWSDNKDKFLGGNIHGVKIGETLNLENLDRHLEGLSQSSAVAIVQSQLAEWKRIPPAQQLSSSFPLQTGQKNIVTPDQAPDPPSGAFERFFSDQLLIEEMRSGAASNTASTTPCLRVVRSWTSRGRLRL